MRVLGERRVKGLGERRREGGGERGEGRMRVLGRGE